MYVNKILFAIKFCYQCIITYDYVIIIITYYYYNTYIIIIAITFILIKLLNPKNIYKVVTTIYYIISYDHLFKRTFSS